MARLRCVPDWLRNRPAAPARQLREDCHTPEVQINPADLGLDGGFAVYDSHGVRLGKVQGSLDWGASADSRALAAFEGKGHPFVAVFVRSPSDHALDLCLPKKRFCWKYE